MQTTFRAAINYGTPLGNHQWVRYGPPAGQQMQYSPPRPSGPPPQFGPPALLPQTVNVYPDFINNALGAEGHYANPAAGYPNYNNAGYPRVPNTNIPQTSNSAEQNNEQLTIEYHDA